MFDHNPKANTGVVCFITVVGFLNGPGFQKMRDYLRRTADAIWVIDCSPEGHQPEVNTRIFQGVQQPVCIVLVSRTAKSDPNTPATVLYHALPKGRREEKFAALGRLALDGDAWTDCATEWRAPFLPASGGAWATYPALEDLFAYNGSGVMPGRTWVIAPDADSLLHAGRHSSRRRPNGRRQLFVPHLRNGEPGDKHTKKRGGEGTARLRTSPQTDRQGKRRVVPPRRYGFRSFDRQWIIPDNRVINQPNPELWRAHSDMQIYMTAFTEESPLSGPALTFTGVIPDLAPLQGLLRRPGLPAFAQSRASEPKLPPKLLGFLAKKVEAAVTAEDLMAYIAAVAANPAYTARFQEDLAQPGLRIPLTASGKLFARRWSSAARSFGCTRSASDARTRTTTGLPDRRGWRRRNRAHPRRRGDPARPESMPDAISYDASRKRLLVGGGYVENVSPEIWNYNVSGKQVLSHGSATEDGIAISRRWETTANEMALCWGVTSFVMPFDFINPQNTIETALKNLAEQGRLQSGATVVIIGAISVGTETSMPCRCGRCERGGNQRLTGGLFSSGVFARVKHQAGVGELSVGQQFRPADCLIVQHIATSQRIVLIEKTIQKGKKIQRRCVTPCPAVTDVHQDDQCRRAFQQIPNDFLLTLACQRAGNHQRICRDKPSRTKTAGITENIRF